MSEWFHIGQKVVCIYAKPRAEWPEEAARFIAVGRVYVVTGVHAPRSPDAAPQCFLSLEGSPGDWQFDCRGFRPLRKRTTSIEIFTQLLNSKPELERA